MAVAAPGDGVQGVMNIEIKKLELLLSTNIKILSQNKMKLRK
jgi:hypothetical protein